MTSVPEIFDRQAVMRHRVRAAGGFAEHDFLIAKTADDLLDRLNDIARKFESILVIGAQYGLMRKKIEALGYASNQITVLDVAEGIGADVVGDEEILPFEKGQFDCVISHLSLPMINDVPGVLMQIKHILKPDGLFLGTTLGVQTLRGFQQILAQADMECFGGMGARVGPFVDIVDAAALMQRVRFALPVVDQDMITVSYRSIIKLMHDLRGMGWSNAQSKRSQNPVSKRFFEIVKRSKNESVFDAQFEILTMTGWAPAENQQKPLRPGSAKNRLADALNTSEYEV